VINDVMVAAPPSAVVQEVRGLARRELARRELARRRLMPFVEYTFRAYRAAAVHRLLAEYLEGVELYIASGGREGIGRLMVFEPPRHGKSELVSVRFPAWFLGRNPDRQVIVASCTGDLAVSFGRQVRNVIEGGEYQNVFGLRSGRVMEESIYLADDSRAANAWSLARQRGGLVAAGVGGNIIGRGAHLAVIDDPFRGRRDAESKAVRDGVDTWYKSELYPRLEVGGAIVLMHQRWHADDLAGRLLRRMVEDPAGAGGAGADRWVVLSLPAVAEEWAGEERAPTNGDRAPANGERAPTRGAPTAGGGEEHEVIGALRDGWWRGVDALGRRAGEALWPERYPLERLGEIRANIGGYEWDAQYQQRPRRLEGALIKAYEIVMVDWDEVPGYGGDGADGEGRPPRPAGASQGGQGVPLRGVGGWREGRYWDLAVSGRQSADYIAGARLGRTSEGRLYIMDMVRLKGPWADARPRMIEVMLRDPASVRQGVEVAGQQGGYYQELQRDPALQGRALEGVNPQKVGNKEVRANIWASRIEDGLVYMVRAPWNDEFLAEAIAFPRGAYDDQVDAVSGAVQMLGSGPVGIRWL